MAHSGAFWMAHTGKTIGDIFFYKKIRNLLLRAKSVTRSLLSVIK